MEGSYNMIICTECRGYVKYDGYSTRCPCGALEIPLKICESCGDVYYKTDSDICEKCIQRLKKRFNNVNFKINNSYNMSKVMKYADREDLISYVGYLSRRLECSNVMRFQINKYINNTPIRYGMSDAMINKEFRDTEEIKCPKCGSQETKPIYNSSYKNGVLCSCGVWYNEITGELLMDKYKR